MVNKNLIKQYDIGMVGLGVMGRVPAGAPVDAVIKEMLEHLQKGDLIIDSGNSYFKDTNLHTLRFKVLSFVSRQSNPEQSCSYNR